MPSIRSHVLILNLLAATAGPALAADAVATVMDRDDRILGTVELTATPSGQVHIVVLLDGIPEGTHGIHIHETGDCSAADFTSAGGHLAGARDHGVLADDGPHPGDLPNAHVDADGRLGVEIFNPLLTLEEAGESAIFDADGSAFIVHADPDDYEGQPSGAAGERIACGVFERADG